MKQAAASARQATGDRGQAAALDPQVEHRGRRQEKHGAVVRQGQAKDKRRGQQGKSFLQAGMAGGGSGEIGTGGRKETIKCRSDEERVESIDFGHHRLGPHDGRKGKDQSGGHGRQPAAVQLAADQEDHRNGQGPEDCRHQVDPIGNVPDRDEREELAEQRVEGVAGGVGDAQLIGDDLELETVVKYGGDGGRQRSQVRGQGGRQNETGAEQVTVLASEMSQEGAELAKCPDHSAARTRGACPGMPARVNFWTVSG